MANAVTIQVGANAAGVYDEIIRQARRAEAVLKKIPLRIETKDLGGFKTLTADIDRFDKSVSRMSAVIVTFGQAAALIFGVQNAFAALLKTSIQVEKQLNDINAIFNASEKTMKSFSNGIFEIAKQTGQSFTVAATAAQEFSRQGLSVSETLKRTRDALTLTRIAGLDAAKATQALTAIFNTFKKEALDTTKITNVLATLDTKFAVSAGDLTEALSRAGAVAGDANTSFVELASAVTSLQQTTARGGSVIGNSLKSIFTRLQRNDTVQALREIGVEVRDLEGNMRPAMKVLQDLSKEFYKLSGAQKATIKEQVAGVYQINQLSALLADLSSGYSTYNEALISTAQTQDAASERLEVLRKTTAGSINDILANLTKFSSEVGKAFTEPLIKSPVDLLNKMFDFTGQISGANEAGAQIGKGLLEGIGTFLGSGGGLLLGKAIFSIGRLVAVGVKDQIIAATTLNRTSEKQLQLQEQVKAVLLSQDAAVQAKLAKATTEVELQQTVLRLITEQTAAAVRFNAIAGGIAKRGIRSGYSPIAASGYIPPVMAEKSAISRGVGGAHAGAKPVVIPNFNFGGGKRETVVANSSEYLVPNFAGGDGSAIFNQKMIKQYGLPKGATKIMSRGYFPERSLKSDARVQKKFLTLEAKRMGLSVDDLFQSNPTVFNALAEEYRMRFPRNPRDQNQSVLASKYGFADGYIPNITASKAGSKAYKALINRQGGAVEDIQSLFGNLFGRGKIPSTRIEDMKENPLFRNFFMGSKGKTWGFYNYDNNSISLNKAQKADMMLKTYSHEMGHAAENNLSKDQLHKLRKALKRDISKRGESVGETFLGSHAKSYKDAEFSESFAESSSKAFLKNQFGGGNSLTDDSLGKDSLMYRYIRRIVSKNFATGHIPNFKKERGSLMGEGSFGSFYNLRGGIGVKRFHSEKYPEDLVREFVASQVLANEKILSGVTGPKVVGSLNRSLRANRIGKQVVSDPLAENSLISGYTVSKALETALRDRGVKGVKSSPDFLDMNTGNFTVNNAGVEMLNSDRGRKTLNKYRYSEKGLQKLSKFFEKKGGLINIIDPGYLVFPKKVSKKYLAGGHIPNFNPLLASLKREASSLQELGYSKDQIFKGLRVQGSSRLKNKGNPTGLGVFNTLQGQNSISQALSDHKGENLHNAGVPNFATPNEALKTLNKVLLKFQHQSTNKFGIPQPLGNKGSQTHYKSAIGFIDDLKKDTGLFRKNIVSLAHKYAALDAQAAISLKVGKLDNITRENLVKARQFYQTFQAKAVNEIRKDPSLIGAGGLSIIQRHETENEKRQVARNNKIQEAFTKRQNADLEKERKESLKINKRQNLLLGASFLLPIGTEIGANLTEKSNPRFSRTLSDASSSLSLGAGVATFGGPVGIGLGALIAGGGIASSVIKNKEAFTGQFTAREEQQRALDASAELSENFGKFQDLFIRFSEAKGVQKGIVGEELGKVISGFKDSALRDQLTKSSFDPSLDLDKKIEQQVNALNKTRANVDIDQNIKAFRTLYDESARTSNVFSRLNGDIDVSQDSIKKFSKFLAGSVDVRSIKGPINDAFVADLLKNTGTGIETQSQFAAKEIQILTKAILENTKAALDLTKAETDKSEKSTFNIENSKNNFNSILRQKDFVNKLGVGVFKARSESPVFDADTKRSLDAQAAQLENTTQFLSELGEAQRALVELKTGKEAAQNTPAIVSLLKTLTSANSTNDAAGIIAAIEGVEKTTGKADEEQKRIVAELKKSVQVASNNSVYLSKIQEATEKGVREAKFLDLFNKMGVKGVENRGRTFGSAVTTLSQKDVALRVANRLPNTPENIIIKKNAEVERAQAFITKVQQEKELAGGSFSEERKNELKGPLLKSFQTVTENKSKSDIQGVVSTIEGLFGQQIRFQLDRFKKTLDTQGPEGALTAFPQFSKTANTQLSYTNLSTKENRTVLNDQLAGLKEYLLEITKNKEIAEINTDAALGGRVSDKSELTSIIAQLLPAQELLESSTNTFATSATELSNALTKEGDRLSEFIRTQNEKFTKDEKDSEIAYLEGKVKDAFSKKQLFELKGEQLAQPSKRSDFLAASVSTYVSDLFSEIGGIINASSVGGAATNIGNVVAETNPFHALFNMFSSERGAKASELLVENKRKSLGYDEAKKELVPEEEFRSFIDKLKKLGRAFNEVTGEITDVPAKYDPYAAAIRRAKTKEGRAGIPASAMYVSSDKRLISPTNPLGVGVANRLDEPNGIHEGVERSIKRGKNPKLSEGGIPNFANPTRNGLYFDSSKSGQVINSKTYVSGGSRALVYDSSYGYTRGNAPGNNYYGDSGKPVNPLDLIPKNKPYPTNPLDLIPKGPYPTHPNDLKPKVVPPTTLPNNVAPKTSSDLPIGYIGNSPFSPIKISPSLEAEINKEKAKKEQQQIFDAYNKKKYNRPFSFDQTKPLFGPLTKIESEQQDDYSKTLADLRTRRRDLRSKALFDDLPPLITKEFKDPFTPKLPSKDELLQSTDDLLRRLRPPLSPAGPDSRAFGDDPRRVRNISDEFNRPVISPYQNGNANGSTYLRKETSNVDKNSSANADAISKAQEMLASAEALLAKASSVAATVTSQMSLSINGNISKTVEDIASIKDEIKSWTVDYIAKNQKINGDKQFSMMA